MPQRHRTDENCLEINCQRDRDNTKAREHTHDAIYNLRGSGYCMRNIKTHHFEKSIRKGNDVCRRIIAQLDMQTTTTSSRICARATSRATLRAGTLVWCIATRPPVVKFSFACSFTFVVSIESFESSLTAHWITKKN